MKVPAKKILIIGVFSLLGILFNACNSCRKEQVPADVKSEPYQKIENGRFHFSFEIPGNWKAVDSSANGDGFFIQTGYPNIDIRIYAQSSYQNNSNELTELCNSVVPFTFADEHAGDLCKINETEFYIYRQDSTTQLTMYVNITKNWKKKHKEKLMAIAKSLAFTN